MLLARYQLSLPSLKIASYLMCVGVAVMLMDILIEVAGRPAGSNRSLLLLGPPGVGMILFTPRGTSKVYAAHGVATNLHMHIHTHKT